MPFPSILIDQLCSVVPGYAQEELRDQRSLAVMLWKCGEGRREHRTWLGMFSFSHQDIRNIWGEDARMRKVVSYRYFTVHQGSNLSHVNSAYAPSAKMAEALVLTLQTHDYVDWLDETGKTLAVAGNAIASIAAKDKAGKGNRQTKWKGAKPTKFIPVDTIALTGYRIALLETWKERPLVHKAAGWVRRQLRAIYFVLMMARSRLWTGCIPIKYEEGRTGRINALGHSLQSMPGLVRKAALAGKWDYDISTCHWTILAQMARRQGVNSPLTDAYVADKNSLRQRVSTGAQISLDDAKQCITALLFDARVQASAKAMFHHTGAIAKKIGVPAALRLSKQRDFTALSSEVRQVGKAIVDAWPRKNSRLVNDLGLTYVAGSMLAHLLQGAEAASLRAVVMQQQSNIILCVHDGWVTNQRLSSDDLAQHIRAEVGYEFVIDESQLQAPGRDQIKRKVDEFDSFSEGELQFSCPFAVSMSHVEDGRDPLRGESPVPGSVSSAPQVGIHDAALTVEVSLWTEYPHPEVPIKSRLSFESPRPRWNLPPGSTADSIDDWRPVNLT